MQAIRMAHREWSAIIQLDAVVLVIEHEFELSGGIALKVNEVDLTPSTKPLRQDRLVPGGVDLRDAQGVNQHRTCTGHAQDMHRT